MRTCAGDVVWRISRGFWGKPWYHRAEQNDYSMKHALGRALESPAASRESSESEQLLPMPRYLGWTDPREEAIDMLGRAGWDEVREDLFQDVLRHRLKRRCHFHPGRVDRVP